jgi:(2Fe-2S) ferredoxin
MGQYKHHVFVCSQGKTCSREGGELVHEALKKAVKEFGLKRMVRINHAGCMNQCGHGPMVVVYPQDVWYARMTVEAARRVAREHLAGGRPVEACRYYAPPGDNKRD